MNAYFDQAILFFCFVAGAVLASLIFRTFRK